MAKAIRDSLKYISEDSQLLGVKLEQASNVVDANLQPIDMTLNYRESRKRLRNPDAWTRNKLRKERYSSKKNPEYPKCNHDNNQFRCAMLNGSDIKVFHQIFYSTTTKLTQDTFLIKYCKGTNVLTRKNKERKKNINIKYYVRKCQSGEMVPVCQKSFLGILNLKKDRVQGVIKRYFESGRQIPKESRGGDRSSEKIK